jgi:hypothetical protein
MEESSPHSAGGRAFATAALLGDDGGIDARMKKAIAATRLRRMGLAK